MGSRTNIIIFSVIAVGALILGLLYSGNTTQSTTSGLVAQRNAGQTSISSFLRQISAIRTITLDRYVFEDPVFRSLQDMSRELTPEEKSRPNPFAPIGRQASFVSQAVATPEPVVEAAPATPATPAVPAKDPNAPND